MLRLPLSLRHRARGCYTSLFMLQEILEQGRIATDQALERLLPPPTQYPTSIHQAMRHSVFAGGKRLRPILCMESARMIAGRLPDGIDELGAAIEMLHTYSLVHDDLPALDNDDLRRGRPTCHKKFGEAMALLAGDALLTLAFETLARAALPPDRSVAVIQEIGAAAGTRDGMVGGQVADLEAEGKPASAEMLEYIHRSKTAALIRASIVSGALSGGAGEDDLLHLRRFGELIGWAFQVTDDILAVEESSAALGKTAGKDQAQQKATYPAVFGLAKSHQFARELALRAVAEMEIFGPRAAHLREIAEFLVLRRT
jgi:geranylgeranyl diphosphate synthase, type II